MKSLVKHRAKQRFTSGIKEPKDDKRISAHGERWFERHGEQTPICGSSLDALEKKLAAI